MPLVVISGRPCSGKSTLAGLLSDACQQQGLEAVVIDEPSLHLHRNASYADSTSEKTTRGLLKAAAERALNNRVIVILDSLNSIKGYRYELYCVARAAATRYCVLYATTPRDVARDYNAARRCSAPRCTCDVAAASDSHRSAGATPEGPDSDATGLPHVAAAVGSTEAAAASAVDGQGTGGDGAPCCTASYHDDVFDDLAGRFEVPDPRNRWDAPLFEVDMRDGAAAASAAVADVITAVRGGPEQARSARVASQLTPTCATTNPALTQTNALYEIDRAAQEVVRAASAAQAANGGATGSLLIQCGDGVALRLPRFVPLSELRNHKRAFIKIATQVIGGRVRDAASAKKMFVEYLHEHLILA